MQVMIKVMMMTTTMKVALNNKHDGIKTCYERSCPWRDLKMVMIMISKHGQ